MIANRAKFGVSTASVATSTIQLNCCEEKFRHGQQDVVGRHAVDRENHRLHQQRHQDQQQHVDRLRKQKIGARRWAA